MKKEDKKYSDASELLYCGKTFDWMEIEPEAAPLFASTAFVMRNFPDVHEAYKQGYTYIRKNNPNRDSLASLVNYLEESEDTLIFSSGMGAITTTVLSLLKSGDHIICNRNIYGETFDLFMELLPKFGIETSMVDFDNPDNVRNELKAETKLIYSEVLANPTLNIADIEELAKIAKSQNALLMIDNTFTTPIAIKPIKHGADIVINSLTKFMSGHSDAIAGSISASKEITDKIRTVRMLVGTSGDPVASWMMLKGMQTVDLRLRKQMKNAAILAQFFESHKHVSKVNHPSLESFAQHELALKIFRTKEEISGMLSIIVPEDEEKINEFMKKLHFAHYAPTLGGLRTSYQHPVTSSHSHMPDKDRRKMGITPGMLRISVGIEDVEDLMQDFEQALSVFD